MGTRINLVQKVRDDLIRAEARLSYYDEVVSGKNKQIEDLQKQVNYLQEALVAKEAPLAFQIQKELEQENKVPESLRKDHQKTMDEIRIVKEYNSMLESGAVIRSPDDLASLFTSVLMQDSEPKSLHGNNES